ncbi:MAG: non-canonical purine NTP pyrophosphatase [Patescibacteria group bacterium]
MVERLTLVTSNPGKINQVELFLGIPFDVGEIKDKAEIQSLSVAEVVRDKAVKAHKELRKPVLVEDTSLIFNAWKDLPGPLIDSFLKTVGNEGMIQMLSTYKNKRAKAISALAYFDGYELYVFQAHVNGTIADEPKGDRGFGWDYIFIPSGHYMTRAQMNDEDYNATNPRLAALAQLKDLLEKKGFQ